jgi:hypothetical protein
MSVTIKNKFNFLHNVSGNNRILFKKVTPLYVTNYSDTVCKLEIAISSLMTLKCHLPLIRFLRHILVNDTIFKVKYNYCAVFQGSTVTSVFRERALKLLSFRFTVHT